MGKSYWAISFERDLGRNYLKKERVNFCEQTKPPLFGSGRVQVSVLLLSLGCDFRDTGENAQASVDLPPEQPCESRSEVTEILPVAEIMGSSQIIRALGEGGLYTQLNSAY